MRTQVYAKQDGFTAIELLITLIVASVFLFAGYQLFSQVMKEGFNANQAARLSNATYVKLREGIVYADANYPSCTGLTAGPVTITSGPQTFPNLGTYKFNTTYSCPYYSTAGAPQYLISIRVDASDDDFATIDMSHATFTN